MKTTVTRTYNPLPFQDLEPKRFEDLVRQLAYDFRTWRRLEATGRSGTDDGFDARGLEIIDTGELLETLDDADEEDSEKALGAERLWLIQCKREKAIGPSKLATYLSEISLAPGENLYGVIFVAACDFSKRARDTYFDWCRTHGIAEGHIWGKGELEDMLYQPKNDNLLFAYFGISLTIRRRTIASQLRSELATKRKLYRTVAKSSAEILVRDPSETDYPYVESGKKPTAWGVYEPEELTHLGLQARAKLFYAYVDRATGEWDAADVVDSMRSDHPWQVDDPEHTKLDDAARETWMALPELNRGWLRVSCFIPLRNIVAIDELGDEVFGGTHVYATFHPKHGPFDGCGYWARLTTTSHYEGQFEPKPEKRVERFPKELRRSEGSVA